MDLIKGMKLVSEGVEYEVLEPNLWSLVIPAHGFVVHPKAEFDHRVKSVGGGKFVSQWGKNFELK